MPAITAILPTDGLNPADRWWLETWQAELGVTLKIATIRDTPILKKFRKGPIKKSGAVHYLSDKSFNAGSKQVYGHPSPEAAAEMHDYRNKLTSTKILAFGNFAFYLLSGISPIGDYRGAWHEWKPGHFVLPTYHPQDDIYSFWPWKKPFLNDIKKAAFTNPVYPKRQFNIRPTLADLEALDAIISAAKILSIDIETIPDSLMEEGAPHITCIGIATSVDFAVTIPLTEGGKSYWSQEDRPKVMALLKKWIEGAPMLLAQNCTYEIQWLDAIDIRIDPTKIHDTMLLHHALDPEQPRSLEHLASLYCNERPWKSMVSFTKADKIDFD